MPSNHRVYLPPGKRGVSTHDHERPAGAGGREHDLAVELAATGVDADLLIQAEITALLQAFGG